MMIQDFVNTGVAGLDSFAFGLPRPAAPETPPTPAAELSTQAAGGAALVKLVAVALILWFVLRTGKK